MTDYFGDLYEKNESTGVETKRYTFGGSLVATLVNGVRTYLYAADLNSVSGSSDGASQLYTPYGMVRQSSGTLPTDHQFQGQQNQGSVGLYHMGARWYDPTIGVWTQPDSVVPNPLDPLTLNRYAFVNGNPLRYADPSGHCPECLIEGGEELYGAVEMAPEWAPAAYAAAASAVTGLAVVVEQRAQAISASLQSMGDSVVAATAGIFINGIDPATGRPKTWRQITSLDRALKGAPNDGMDAHHLIPQELRNDPVVARARRLGWQLNGADNGILLPDTEEDGRKKGLPAHTSNHPGWTRHVQDKLNDIQERAVREQWGPNDKRWVDALDDLDQQLRDEINDPSQHPPGEPLG